jgi:hypothetical protein
MMLIVNMISRMFWLTSAGCIILLMGISLQVCAFQDEESDVAWYESFFQEGKRKNVDSEQEVAKSPGATG